MLYKTQYNRGLAQPLNATMVAQQNLETGAMDCVVMPVPTSIRECAEIAATWVCNDVDGCCAGLKQRHKRGWSIV